VVALKALLVTVLVALVSACSSSTKHSEPSSVVRVTEHNNGKTVTVSKGDEVDVVLSNTYWTIQTPASTIVTAEGANETQPQLQGCVPGGGCGTVTQRFKAAAPGVQTITAGRAICGEALRCVGDQGRYEVTITVQ
jgi:hypothetical protein